jgi:ElaB/YqjD/DUF883 family membrane-anchored ribosome-binding protein
VYKSWQEFEADVELIWTNAFAFNEDGSQVYEDAKKLKTEFEKVLKEKKTALGESSDQVSQLFHNTINMIASESKVEPATTSATLTINQD